MADVQEPDVLPTATATAAGPAPARPEPAKPKHQPPPRRQLRERTKKLYSDDWIADDDFEGKRGFQVEEKIESDKYNLENFAGFYREMTGTELSVAYLQKHGLGVPLLIKDKTGLGLRVPSTNFTVNDVRTCVGSRRLVDVMDVNTQKNEEMSMKEWQKYYEDPNKERLLNVISLEFSHTKLEHYVQSPTIVRQIDWVDVVWPKHLKDAQTEATNLIEDMMYPKVQKYCLMSVKGCYTDFHVDFGGTSVWYHIIKGGKIFWLIPPTEKNITLYEKWVLSGKQSDTFFGDMVDKCGRITLNAGMTMFIPTGWIHAVYTPEDSLVFGGNFLHCFGIDKQLRVAQVEEVTKVPQKFRYPFFTEMLWYVLERYVHVLLGRSHLDVAKALSHHALSESPKHVHLTPLELHGLKSIVMYLHSLPSTKKNVPELIQDPVALIHDVRCLVEQHRHDSPKLAVTGIPVLPPPPVMTIAEREKAGRKKLIRPLKELKPGVLRRRRTRCKKCEACTRTDCGECVYCLDMVKFGGSGRAKQTCMMRQCLRPVLPITAACRLCNLDGWGQTPAPLMGKQAPTVPSSLMECSICFEIVHPECLKRDDLEGLVVISDDVPSSWECPECCESGKNIESKVKLPKGRPRKQSLSNTMPLDDTDSEKATTPVKKIKHDMDESWNGQEVAEGHQDNQITIPQNQMAAQNNQKTIPQNLITDQNDQKTIPQNQITAQNDEKTNPQNQMAAQNNQRLIPQSQITAQNSQRTIPESQITAQNNEKIILQSQMPAQNNQRTVPQSQMTPQNNEKIILQSQMTAQNNQRTISQSHVIIQNEQRTIPQSQIAAQNNQRTISLSQMTAQNEQRIIPQSQMAAQNNQRTIFQSPMTVQNNQKTIPQSQVIAQTYQRTIPQNHMTAQVVLRNLNSVKSPFTTTRPVPAALNHKSNEYFEQPYIFNKIAILSIFKYLNPNELINCACVCKTWSRYSLDPSLWKKIDLSHSILTAPHLSGIIQRQPETLILDWTNIVKKQLAWLLNRLPQLRNLSVRGCTWSGVCALNTYACPSLTSLDLSYVAALNDSSLREILSPPTDSRPGLIDKTSRLKYLRSLSLCGTDITDVALRYIAQHLAHLEMLDLSSCTRVTDAGVAQLASPPAATVATLVSLNLSGCRLLTEHSLSYLQRCQALKKLDLRDAIQVSRQRAESFAAIGNLNTFHVDTTDEIHSSDGGSRSDMDYRETERATPALFAEQQQQQAALCKYTL